MRRPLWSALAAALAAFPAAADEVDPRRDMEVIERALDAAVRQVSRAKDTHLLGAGEVCRGYHLRGYGAVFVLSPRVLPARPAASALFPLTPGPWPPEAVLEAVIRAMEEQIKRVSSPDLRAQMTRRLESLRRTRDRYRTPQGEPPARRPQDATPLVSDRKSTAEREVELRALEAQAQAFQREAEKARGDTERALEEMRREVQSRLMPPPAPEAARTAPSAPEPPAPITPPAPASVVLQPREGPDARSAPEPSEASPALLAPPAPPWRFWFEEDETPGRTSDAVIRDVRAAVTKAIETYGGSLRSLRPEEYVVVAVDFFPRGSFGSWERPERTLVVRVRKKELLEREAGKLPPEELQKRIEYVEY